MHDVKKKMHEVISIFFDKIASPYYINEYHVVLMNDMNDMNDMNVMSNL